MEGGAGLTTDPLIRGVPTVVNAITPPAVGAHTLFLQCHCPASQWFQGQRASPNPPSESLSPSEFPSIGTLMDTGFFGLDMMSIFLKGRSWLSEVGLLYHGFVYWEVSCLLMTLIHRKPRIEKDGSHQSCGHGFVFWSFTTNKFFKVNKDNHLSNFR